jgi:hypothetical protein
MDSNMLYGYMFGGGGLMAAVVMLLVTFMSIKGVGKYIILGIFFVLSWLVHFGFLTWLQAEACSGVKSFGSIAIGAFLGALFTAGCLAIPLHVDSMRLAFSDLLMTHYALLTPEVSEFARKFVSVMRGGAPPELVDPPVPTAPPASLPIPTAPPLPTAPTASKPFALRDLLDQAAYEKQTVAETSVAAPCWAFMAGAVGIGIGNLFSGSKCT